MKNQESKYRRKEEIVKAMVFTGVLNNPERVVEFSEGKIEIEKGLSEWGSKVIKVHRSNGVEIGIAGDYVVKKEDGTIEFVKPYKFREEYEEVKEDEQF